MDRKRRWRSRITPITAALVTLGAASVVAQAAPAAATTPPAVGQQMAIPAYINPGTKGPYWSQIDAAGSSLGFVVANVDNGPGSASDPGWASTLGTATSDGVKVLGYVDTGYFGVPDDSGTAHTTTLGDTDTTSWLVQAEQHVDEWYKFYGSNIGGIFFDEGLTSCGPTAGSSAYVDLYRELNDYVKANHPGALTVINPGAPADSCYANASDILVTFEGNYSTYTSLPTALQPEAWQLSYDPKKFWNLVYGVPDVTSMQTVVNDAKANNVGYFYATNDDLPNPWDTVPDSTYFPDEQSALAVTDSTSPTTPSTPYSVSVGSTSATVAWTSGSASNNVGYDVYLNGAYAGEATNLTPADSTFTLDGLSPSTSYTVTVKARDLAGTVSSASSGLSITTGAASSTAPTAPGSLTTSGVGPTSTYLSWTASTASSGSIAHYDISEDGTKIITVDGSTTSVHLGGMAPASSHTFSVVARDSTGAVSAASNTVSVTTTNPPPLGAVSGALSASTSGDDVFSAQFNLPYDFHHVFIDTDQNESTGYLGGIGTSYVGAEYMIENNILYQYSGSNQLWGWTQVAGVTPLQSSSGGLYQWSVPASDLGNPTAVNVLYNGSGTSADVYSGVVTLTS